MNNDEVPYQVLVIAYCKSAEAMAKSSEVLARAASGLSLEGTDCILKFGEPLGDEDEIR